MNTPAVRILRATLLLAFLTAPLAAQWAPAPRIVSYSSTSVDPAPGAPAIRGQLPAAFAGLLVGTVLGVGTGLMLGMGQDDGNGFEAVAITATVAGMLGGATYGVYHFSEAKGANGRALPTFGGAALGLLGGPLLWVTVPLGARWGYNRSR